MNMQRTFKKLGSLCLSLTVASSSLFQSLPALAASAREGLGVAAEVAYGSGSPTGIGMLVGNVINVVISISGVILVLLIVYSGFLYLTAMGDKTKIDKAKTMLTQGIIGLVLILMAYGVATFVIDQLTEVTTT